MPHDLDNDDDDEAESLLLEDLVAVHTVGGDDDEDVPPSELLGNTRWVQSAVELFCLQEYAPSWIYSDAPLEDKQTKELAELQTKADVLLKMLRQRLKQHINVRAPSRKDHWVWKFARKNLSVVAAYMVLAGHTKSRLTCIREDGALLAPNVNKFAPCAQFPEHEGCYLFFDQDNGVFIRSGKVSGRGVGSRLLEHKSGSEAAKASSQFYDLYPSEHTARSEKRDKRGYFEDLIPLFAAGFDADCAVFNIVAEDMGDGGQFELGYDLAIAPRDNVSKSPGFESFVGIFGGIE